MHDELAGCRKLWCEVIRRAVLDATTRPDKTLSWGERSQARSWLLDGSPDFVAVCRNAGMDYEAIRDGIREIEQNGWVQ